jgi:hypothetical protein
VSWSGFGSYIAEFGITGAIGTGVYQILLEYNCHEPGCWRVGNHPAADGRFFICHRDHPDYQGKNPTTGLIGRLHQQHLTEQAALPARLVEIRDRLTSHTCDDRSTSECAERLVASQTNHGRIGARYLSPRSSAPCFRAMNASMIPQIPSTISQMPANTADAKMDPNGDTMTMTPAMASRMPPKICQPR